VLPDVPLHGAEIACRSSACSENGRADWRSWQGGTPIDRLFVLPVFGNPQQMLCNRGRLAWVPQKSVEEGPWMSFMFLERPG
jgi:hypothetical protein